MLGLGTVYGAVCSTVRTLARTPPCHPFAECPAQWVEGEQGGATPLGTSMLALRSWRDLAALVLWFR